MNEHGRVGIARLIDEYRMRTGASYAELSRLTGLGRSYFGWLLSLDEPTWVRTDTLAKLSTGLGIPLSALHLAACETAGYNVMTTSRLPDRYAILLERIKLLDERDVTSVEALVASMVERTSLGV